MTKGAGRPAGALSKAPRCMCGKHTAARAERLRLKCRIQGAVVIGVDPAKDSDLTPYTVTVEAGDCLVAPSEEKKRKLLDIMAAFNIKTAAQLQDGAVAAPPDELPRVIDCPVEDVVGRPWLPELLKLEKKAEFENVSEDFISLLGGPFNPPKRWSGWNVQQKAAWLDENHPIIEDEF